MSSMALEGLRVVDFTQVWAGPLSGRFLADFGAEVIKVESIQYPDHTRFLHTPKDADPETEHNQGAFFHQFNRNKYGITLDVAKSRGKELLMKLVSKADIFVENYGPRVMKNLGLTYEDLIKVKPDIIMLGIHGYGLTGPYSKAPAYGSGPESLAGYRSLVGYGDGIPVPPGMTLADPTTAMHGMIAVMAAVNYRRQTGKGQFIDLSLHDVISSIFEEGTLPYLMNGTELKQLGTRHANMAPHGCYRCKEDDSYIAIAVSSDKEWEAFCKVIGNEALTEERFSDPLSRWQNQDELDRLIEGWTIRHVSSEAMDILQKAGIAAGAVLNAHDVLKNPHLNKRKFFWQVTAPNSGTHPMAGAGMELSDTPGTLRMPPPALGEHNEYILGELLGVSTEELEELKKDKIIGDKPLNPW